MPRGRPRKTEEALFKSAEFIGWALGGIEREIVTTRERLAALTARANQLRARVSTGTATGRGAAAAAGDGAAEPTGRRRRRRSMSPEARKRISEMMKKRWAERRRGK
jgi:hypothetical protein